MRSLSMSSSRTAPALDQRVFLRLFLVVAILGIPRSPALHGSAERPLEDFVGTYLRESGDRIIVDWFDGRPLGGDDVVLAFLDVATGTIRTLDPMEDDGMAYGPTLLRREPRQGRILFERESTGKIVSLSWLEESRTVRARRSESEARASTVRFSGASREIKGRLLRSPEPGPWPGLVMIHGSGPGGRFYLTYGLISRYLAALGQTVLTYDKRGFDGSDGAPWREATVPELAEDTVAAVEFLRGREGVDEQAIGLWGHSQGGWVAPLVARQTEISSLVLIAAPAVSTWSQELDSVRHDLKARGIGEEEIGEALRAMEFMFAAAMAGGATPELKLRAKHIESLSWSKWVPFSTEPTALRGWRRAFYDPEPVLRLLTEPVFLAFGAFDTIVPPHENASRWVRLLEESGNDDYLLRIYPESGHGMLRAEGTHAHGSGGSLVPGFLAEATSWLRSRAPANCSRCR